MVSPTVRAALAFLLLPATAALAAGADEARQAYAAAKMLEAGDAWVFEATGHLVSGHTLKHGVAALAALPVLAALQQVGARGLRHNPGAAAATA